MIIKRLKEATQCKSKSEICAFFGITSKTLDNWELSGKLPLEKAVLLRLSGGNPDYVETGEGEPRLEMFYPEANSGNAPLSPCKAHCPLLPYLNRLQEDLRRLAETAPYCACWTEFVRKK